MNYTYFDIDFDINREDKVRTYIANTLSKYGMILSNYCAITFLAEDIKKYLAITQNDLVIIKLSEDYNKNKALKDVISECFKTFLVKNSAASFAIESCLRLHSGNFTNIQDFESESVIPDGAEPLTSDLGFVQGFYLRKSNINLVFLPPDVSQVKDIMDNKLTAILSKLYSLPTEFIYLKVFGMSEDALVKTLQTFRNNSIGVNINYSIKNLDALISVGYQQSTDSIELQDFVAQICESLHKYLYATEDITLQQMALDLIKLTGKKISIIESITKGRVLFDFANIDTNTLANIQEHHIISGIKDLDYLQTLNLNTVTMNGLYSVDSTYEIATAMIDRGDCDLVISSIGAYNVDTMVANCYLAIGDIEGVHIYKQSFAGSEADVMDLATKNIYFYIIRKLKQNNLLFDQTLTN